MADALARVRALLAALSKAPATIAQQVAPELQKVVAREFADGVGPDGKTWAPLKPSTIAKGRSAPPLTATGRMRGSATAIASGSTVTVTIAAPAQYHQGGTSRLPARPLVPETGTLPATWKAAVDSVGARVIEGKLK